MNKVEKDDVVLICKMCYKKTLFNAPCKWLGAFERTFPDVEWSNDKVEFNYADLLFYKSGHKTITLTYGRYVCDKCQAR